MSYGILCHVQSLFYKGLKKLHVTDCTFKEEGGVRKKCLEEEESIKKYEKGGEEGDEKAKELSTYVRQLLVGLVLSL